MMGYPSVSAVRADAIFARIVTREAFADPAPEPGPGADTGWWPVIRQRTAAEHTSSSASGAVT
jgi:hypothetical protein